MIEEGATDTINAYIDIPIFEQVENFKKHQKTA